MSENLASNILEMKQIYKFYPGVKALDGVNFSVRSGEVHALLGENGAGKSTLIKVLAGSTIQDSGEIYFRGERRENYSPNQAIQMGISVIYQEFNLLPAMTVEENLSLGKELKKSLFLDRQAMLKRAREIIAELGVDINPKAYVKDLSVAYQQMVEILKAMLNRSPLLVMDEPSATLTNKELKTLYALIRGFKDRGGSVVYISHRLEEIFEIADRVTVLRDGHWIDTMNIQDTNKHELISKMVGREIEDEYPKVDEPLEEVVLSVSGLYNKKVSDVSFELHKGEIFGIAGLVGSGRTEIIRSIFGADPYIGQICVRGALVKAMHPVSRIAKGIGLVPEDRKSQGALLDMSVAENLTIASLRQLVTFLLVNRNKEKELVNRYINELSIKTPSAKQLVKNLSGGNQQKVIVTKWLATECDVLLFDEPTRGIDIGAKHEIYRLMADLAQAGKSIIMVSSELPELIGMSHRIMVMYEGRSMGILDGKDHVITQESIMTMASGEGSK